MYFMQRCFGLIVAQHGIQQQEEKPKRVNKLFAAFGDL